MDFTVPADNRVKINENEKRNEYRDLAKVLKKRWNKKVMVIPIVVGALGKFQKIDTETGRLENKRISWNYPDYI